MIIDVSVSFTPLLFVTSTHAAAPPAAVPAYNPGYAPQQPPPQPYYPPAPQPYPAAPPQPYLAAPPPAPMAQQQSNTNVVVVGQQAPQQTTIIQRPKEKVNHVLHLLITIFLFPPWAIVWMILCCIYGC